MRGEPFGDGGEGGGYDEREDVLLRPRFEGRFDAVLLLDPPGFGEAWKVEEGEVVEMDAKPLRFPLGGAFLIQCESDDIEFGGVDGFAADYS